MINNTKITLTVLMDKRDGSRDCKRFKNREAALRFAEEELKWEDTLSVSVQTEIFNEEGSFA